MSQRISYEIQRKNVHKPCDTCNQSICITSKTMTLPEKKQNLYSNSDIKFYNSIIMISKSLVLVVIQVSE